MVHFRTREITHRIFEIHGICHERMFLIEGDRTAALIDTGSGFGSLRKVVDSITQKPVIVLLTHGHVDHAMGAREFDTVYFNHADDEVFDRHSGKEFRLDGLNHTRDGGEFVPSDYIDSPDRETFLPLKEGDSFDLGGITLRAYACPGHTAGTMVFLDEEDRILFSGDAFSNATFLLGEEALPVEDFERNLCLLETRLHGRFDRVLESHGTGELPATILKDVMLVCCQVMAGDTDRIPYSFRGYNGFLAKERFPHSLARVDGGRGNLEYDESKIFSSEKGEKA